MDGWERQHACNTACACAQAPDQGSQASDLGSSGTHRDGESGRRRSVREHPSIPSAPRKRSFWATFAGARQSPKPPGAPVAPPGGTNGDAMRVSHSRSPVQACSTALGTPRRILIDRQLPHPVPPSSIINHVKDE
jgi:hypothetical protein